MPDAGYPLNMPVTGYLPPGTSAGHLYVPAYFQPASAYVPQAYRYGSPSMPEQAPLLGFSSYPTYTPPPGTSPADLPPPYALIDNDHTDYSVPPPGAEPHLYPNVLQNRHTDYSLPPPSTEPPIVEYPNIVLPNRHSDYSMPSPHTEPPLVEYRNIILQNPKISGVIPKQGRSYKVYYRRNSPRLGGTLALEGVGPLQMEAVAEEFPSHSPKNETLFAFVKGKIKSGSTLQAGLVGLVLGPMRYDTDVIHDAISDEGSLQDLGRLAYVYEERYKTRLRDDILRRAHDLKSGYHPRPFSLRPILVYQTALDPHRRLLPDPLSTSPCPSPEDDVRTLVMSVAAGTLFKEETHKKTLAQALHTALQVDIHDERASLIGVCIDSSDPSVVDKKTALLFIARDPDPDPKHPDLDPQVIWEAIRLEETMTGIGAREKLIVMRLLRAHWSRDRIKYQRGLPPAVREDSPETHDQWESDQWFVEALPPRPRPGDHDVERMGIGIKYVTSLASAQIPLQSFYPICPK
ncbi:hypothetical protein DFH07DRAFT_782998 [Mycena maculata]|uniref:Uncharacterized protein n=1 Tax=Mycena maculata TaxID=230809 RepID=A0AAD7MNE8_9AGAR|nr:hypothetical protein DFH07DRAFT_782998 [Mycena maculata]